MRASVHLHGLKWTVIIIIIIIIIMFQKRRSWLSV